MITHKLSTAPSAHAGEGNYKSLFVAFVKWQLNEKNLLVSLVSTVAAQKTPVPGQITTINYGSHTCSYLNHKWPGSGGGTASIIIAATAYKF